MASSVVGLLSMLRAMAPEHDWHWLAHRANVLAANQTPTRPKHHRIVTPEAILSVAFEEMLRLRANQFAEKHAFSRYRNALMIAIAANVPLRRRNLCGLSLGGNFKRIDQGWLIDISGTDTKNRDPIVAELASILTPFIDVFVRDVHPRLLRHTPCDALWINALGKPMTGHALYLRFIKATKRLYGRPLNPHLLRDCAATSLAGYSPDHVLIARDLLGQRDQRSTEEHYIHAPQREASRRANVILKKKLRR